MNKVIFGLILAVCVLGMALLMLNERLGRNPEPQEKAAVPQIVTEKEVGLEPAAPATTPAKPEEDESAAEMARAAAEFERKMAIESLAPPARDIDEISREDSMPPSEEMPGIPEERNTRVVESAPARPDPSPKPAPSKPVAAQVAEEAPKPAPRPAPKAVEPQKPGKSVPPKPETRPAAQAKPKAATPGQKDITRFVVFARDKGATIRISGNQPLRYKNMELDNPPRLVIDFDGEWKFPADQGVPKNALVDKVRVGKMGNKTRLVIDLKAKPRVSRLLPGKNGDSLDWRVDQ